jgi:hypothetical protein
MKPHWPQRATALALITPATAIGTLPATAAPQETAPVNPVPAVVPSLHEWAGGSGELKLSAASRIVVGSGLDKVGQAFAADLSEMTGLQLPVVSGAAAPGDIILAVNAADSHPAGGQRYAEEGYRLTATADGVTLTAPTETGVYYGTRSLLQILAQTNGRNIVPLGSATDWPDYEARGFVLDVGRRFFTPEFVRDYIKMMSYYKLNRFQMHLNDNELFPVNTWPEAYTGFRLATDNPAFAGLVSTDGAYTKADWNSFEDEAATRGVTIIPEIDAPAHAGAIIKWKPEVGLNGGNSDHLDLSKPVTTQVMKDIFDEFTPWFRSDDVNFGADEYPRELTEDFRNYYNNIAAHLRTLGKKPSAWGSFSKMRGSVEGYDKDVTINSWNNGWYGLTAAEKDGMKFINTNDATLYVVPFADYYHGNGLNNQSLYQNWTPNEAAGQTVEPESVMGAMFAVWNDLVGTPYTEMDVHKLIEATFPVIAQKSWTAVDPALPYAGFTSTVQKVGMGPGLVVINNAGRPAAPGEVSTGAPVAASSTADGFPA